MLAITTARQWTESHISFGISIKTELTEEGPDSAKVGWTAIVIHATSL